MLSPEKLIKKLERTKENLKFLVFDRMLIPLVISKSPALKPCASSFVKPNSSKSLVRG